MSVIGLPVNLGAVADVADKKGCGGRFALNSVLVEVTEPELKYAADGMGPPAEVTDRTYRVTATDTKRLVTVEGPCGPTDEVPGLAGVRTAPNSGTKGVFPLAVFKKTFADADKATRRLSRRPELRQVLASISPVDATLGYTDCEAERVQYTPLIAEKFPPVAEVVKSTRKTKPKATISVDPKMLAELLKTMAAFCGDEQMRVDIEVRDENKAIILTCRNAETGQTTTGLIMPLAG